MTTRDGKALGPALHSSLIEGDAALVTGRFATPSLWTAETPRLYDVTFTLRTARAVLHETTARFGFRTFEVRDQIVQVLTQERRQKALEDYLDALRAKAEIRQVKATA